LIGWGVQNITFIDNGLVSYSNPSRQCLFELSDCEQKKYKAVAAAEALKRVLPGLNATAVVMTIPMPGHPFAPVTTSESGGGAGDGGDREEVVALRKLDELIREHDVVFALTDSREARWLPTVLCAAHDKVISEMWVC
jgi:ubiquitin-like modifier-activating enzyme ATG7